METKKMNEFFSSLENVLFCPNPLDKFTLFEDFYSNFLDQKNHMDHNYLPKNQKNPSYAGFCNIVHPTKISRPKMLQSNQNLAKIIHSLAHIEYSAIDLALDAAYRFQNLPTQYYKDWLEVANQEINHFKLLQNILNDLGFSYGDFDVHNNLYEAMVLTSSSVFDRMGLVHKGLEAMGLDANPFVVEKIKTSSHPIKSKIIQVLEIILRDEISHVNKGNKWWKYTNTTNLSFNTFVKRFSNFSIIGKIPNIEARIIAGFEENEILDIINATKQKVIY
ncbi:ferritin-like domain-containing protein [Helicobacter cappadocius]|uniref:Ferritin-like domain-containing protein n=1 Tax=Helicobacter cappadocius TaxID=3063998 RepID=A0AA90PRW9_9HELI|nr:MULTISPECIES: ferritin-like domain-containing protein [unclassified Helicobacter]MDO7253034.1 ferritin-like domain-containing protein [Helicobacter sp. faydin-H75]MDP2538977.1 ferritin-like domain-containing protein [Helicobacter sp. faydin-H76]